MLVTYPGSMPVSQTLQSSCLILYQYHIITELMHSYSQWSLRSGMGLRHRQLAHGELKMAWASWEPCTTRPGGP